MLRCEAGEKELKKAELRELLIDAWLTKAPKKIARQWLETND